MISVKTEIIVMNVPGESGQAVDVNCRDLRGCELY